MSDALEVFLVRPDVRGGWALSGPGMRYTLWFDRDEDAVAYAKLRMDGKGGRIVTLGRDGDLVRAETVVAE